MEHAWGHRDGRFQVSGFRLHRRNSLGKGKAIGRQYYMLAFLVRLPVPYARERPRHEPWCAGPAPSQHRALFSRGYVHVYKHTHTPTHVYTHQA